MIRAGKRTAEGADAAAAGSVIHPTSSLKSAETTTVSAHLITVPSTGIRGESAAPFTMKQDAIEEIARGIIRCLKRKKSPPASKVYLALPPGSDRRTKETSLAWLLAAWQKLEQYNGYIGVPKLMADAELEF